MAVSLKIQEKNLPDNKRTIPKALKEQVWIKYNGEKFSKKCYISWCKNKVTVFNFECGHNIPFSKGGSTTIDNLLPICSSCNKSMSNNYTIDEWIKFQGKFKRCCLFF